MTLEEQVINVLVDLAENGLAHKKERRANIEDAAKKINEIYKQTLSGLGCYKAVLRVLESDG